MDVISILVGAATVIVVLALVLRPLIVDGLSYGTGRRSGGSSALARQLDQRARLLEKRNAVYAAIRELDFDHETGKVSDEDYTRERGRLVEEGIAILKQLDALADEAPAQDPLEAAIAAVRRGEASPQVRAVPEAGLEAQISQMRSAANGKLTCPECGSRVGPADVFCGQCGHELTSALACPACRTPYQAGDLFCAHCGAALEAQG